MINNEDKRIKQPRRKYLWTSERRKAKRQLEMILVVQNNDE